jgi:hypothetical protein
MAFVVPLLTDYTFSFTVPGRKLALSPAPCGEANNVRIRDPRTKSAFYERLQLLIGTAQTGSILVQRFIVAIA